MSLPLSAFAQMCKARFTHSDVWADTRRCEGSKVWAVVVLPLVGMTPFFPLTVDDWVAKIGEPRAPITSKDSLGSQ